jgi:hypothetical protein
MAQIARVDRKIMNDLFADEYAKLSGSSVVAAILRYPEAFTDHGDYLDSLHECLTEANSWEETNGN